MLIRILITAGVSFFISLFFYKLSDSIQTDYAAQWLKQISALAVLLSMAVVVVTLFLLIWKYPYIN